MCKSMEKPVVIFWLNWWMNITLIKNNQMEKFWPCNWKKLYVLGFNSGRLSIPCIKKEMPSLQILSFIFIHLVLHSSPCLSWSCSTSSLVHDIHQEYITGIKEFSSSKKVFRIQDFGKLWLNNGNYITW